MSTKKLRNVSLRDMRKFLKHKELEKIRTKGGHETWFKQGMLRGITLQTHIDPVPEFIVKQILETLSVTREDFINGLGLVRIGKHNFPILF